MIEDDLRKTSDRDIQDRFDAEKWRRQQEFAAAFERLAAAAREQYAGVDPDAEHDRIADKYGLADRFTLAARAIRAEKEAEALRAERDRLRAVALEVAKACEVVHNSDGRNDDIGFAFRFACIRIDEAIGIRPEGWGASAVALRALAGGAE